MKRFKIMPDETVAGGLIVLIDNGADVYREAIDAAKQDIQTAGLDVTYPTTEWPIVGFEVSQRTRDWIMENGNHYPMTDQQADDADQWMGVVNACADVIAAQQARYLATEEQ